MNCTPLTLTGLLLAVPLAAQQPSANEIKASELLQLSAEQAMAGHETEAAKLAEMAMELLASKASSVEGEIRMVFEENDGHLKGNVVIVDGPDGREVIGFIGSEDVEFEGGRNYWHDTSEDGSEWRSAPMDGGDLHQQLREIQHELESLRHELHALRSEMGGGRRGGMQGQHRLMRFPSGEWNMGKNLQLHGGKRLQYRMAPGHMYGLENLGESIGEEMMDRLHEMGIDPHAMHFGEMEDMDFDFEFPEGAEIHKEVVVIINGEKFTGDEARKKLEELNLGEMGIGRMRMGAPVPPEPPKAPSQRGTWQRRSGGQDQDHEDA